MNALIDVYFFQVTVLWHHASLVVIWMGTQLNAE
jgi:hypothetical protein